MARRQSRLIGILALAAVTSASLVASAGPATSAQAPDDTIQVLGINDFHGRIQASGTEAGAAVLAGAVDQLRAQHPETVFAAAGDLIGASTFESFIQSDKPTIDALNAAGLEVSAVGNHEFDQGYDDLVNRVMAPYDPVTNPLGGATWEYLGANVRLANGDPALPESWIQDFGEVQVGFVGAVTDHLPELVSPDGIAGLTIEAPVAAANRTADQLKAEGADLVILLVHEGAATTALSSATDPASDFGEIVNGANANIDAIISGHTHLAYNHAIDVPAWAGRAVTKRPVVSAGQYGVSLNQLLFRFEAGTDDLVGIDQNLLPLVKVPPYPTDPAVDAIVQAARAQAAVLGAVELGEISGPFNRARVNPITAQNPMGTENRGGESRLGNLVAEAQRWATGADIAFMNPGGLRADMVGTIADGYPEALTYKQAADVQPFANTLVNMTLTGTQIAAALEQQWQPTGAARPFLRLGISEGFTYTYDPLAPAGSRITQMWLGGTPVAATASYSVTVNSFLAAGGDNFPAFAAGADKRDTGQVDLEAMVDYAAAIRPLAPDHSQRSVGVSFAAGSPTEYGAGDTVSFTLSSLAFPAVVLGPSDVFDANVEVSVAGTPVGAFPVDNAVGTAPFDEYGTATVRFAIPSGIPTGTQVMTITGDATKTTTTIPITIGPATSTTSLTRSAPGQVYGSSNVVTLTAAVTVAGGAPATGSVDLVAGGVVLATVPLSGGSATYTLPATQPAGTLTISAVYSGANGIKPSTSTPVTVVVAKATTTTALIATSGTYRRGSWLPTALISLTVQDNGRLPRGTIQIRDGSTVVATVPTAIGLSIYLVPSRTSIGTHTYTATFVPQDPANHDGSTSNPVTIRVVR